MKNLTKTSFVLTIGLATVAALTLTANAQPGGRPNRFLPGGGVAAQEGDSAAHGLRPRRVSPLITALDANQDALIDATEIANAPAALATLDTDQDGALTIGELRPARPERPERPERPANADLPDRPERPERPVPPVVAALDANGDAVIDATEIANASAALATLDIDEDGQLSLAEIHPLRAEGGRGPGHRGGGHRGRGPRAE